MAHAIQAHSFSADIEPATLEARALRDADRRDALGAVGVARCFAVGGALGRALVDPEDPLAERRSFDDGRWGLDHFQTKLPCVPEGMETAAGRRIAEDRATFVLAFLRRMAEECGVARRDWSAGLARPPERGEDGELPTPAPREPV